VKNLLVHIRRTREKSRQVNSSLNRIFSFGEGSHFAKMQIFIFISDLIDPSPVDVVHLTLAVHSVLSLLLVHRGPQVQPARPRSMQLQL
jgi:hypothetical protein